MAGETTFLPGMGLVPAMTAPATFAVMPQPALVASAVNETGTGQPPGAPAASGFSASAPGKKFAAVVARGDGIGLSDGVKPNGLFAASLGAMTKPEPVKPEDYARFAAAAAELGILIAYFTGANLQTAEGVIKVSSLPEPAVISTESGLAVYVRNPADQNWVQVRQWDGVAAKAGWGDASLSNINRAMWPIFGSSKVQQLWRGPQGVMLSVSTTRGPAEVRKQIEGALERADIPKSVSVRGAEDETTHVNNGPVVLVGDPRDGKLLVLIQPQMVNQLPLLQYVSSSIGIDDPRGVFFAGHSWRHENILLSGAFGVLTGAYSGGAGGSFGPWPLTNAIVGEKRMKQVWPSTGNLGTNFADALCGMEIIGREPGLGQWRDLALLFSGLIIGFGGGGNSCGSEGIPPETTLEQMKGSGEGY